MQKTIVALIAVFGLVLAMTVTASPVARVTALAATVWLQQGDATSRLTANVELSIGDRIVTGDNGRAEIQLWSDLVLRVYPGTEIRIQPGEKTSETSGDSPAELYLHLGKICVQTGPPSSSGRHFVLKVTDSMTAEIHQSAHICVSRIESLSSIRLRQGSVQLTNSIDPSIIVLSEAGIEYSQNDDGSYQLLPPTDPDTVTAADPEPFITESEFETQPAQTEIDAIKAATVIEETGALEEETAVPVSAETNAPVTESDISANGYIYTVYLFSTRSEEVANQVNERFQRAGHDSRILVNEQDSPVRYRIAVPGFKSRQSAKEFAASIVGKLGIRDTWIGRDQSASAD